MVNPFPPESWPPRDDRHDRGFPHRQRHGVRAQGRPLPRGCARPHNQPNFAPAGMPPLDPFMPPQFMHGNARGPRGGPPQGFGPGVAPNPFNAPAPRFPGPPNFGPFHEPQFQFQERHDDFSDLAAFGNPDPRPRARAHAGFNRNNPAPAGRPDPLASVLMNKGYAMEKKLGEGTFGICFAAQSNHRSSRGAVAVKVSKARGEADGRRGVIGREAADLLHEGEILASLRGQPGILQVFDCFNCSELNCAMLVTERAAGDVFHLHRSLGRNFDFEELRDLFSDLINALQYLVYEAGLSHRDLHSGNIFFKEGPRRYLLADFGMAGRIGTHDRKHGAVFYMPPELLRKQPPKPTSDLYSLTLNVLILEGTVSNRSAHRGEAPDLRGAAASRHWGRFAPCLSERPEDRPSVAQVKDVIDGMYIAEHRQPAERFQHRGPGNGQGSGRGRGRGRGRGFFF